MMNRVQELIDENKDQIPTGLAKVLLDACKEEADAAQQLYRLTWTTVAGHVNAKDMADDDNTAGVRVIPKTETLIVEVVQDRPQQLRSTQMPYHGMVLASWMKYPMPHIVDDGYEESKFAVIHSIVPYEPRKRQRVQ